MANQTHEYAGLGASSSQVAFTILVLAAAVVTGPVVRPDHVVSTRPNPGSTLAVWHGDGSR